MEDPVVVEVAKAHGKTTAQVLLRFLTQQNIVVIPKSTNPDRIKANLEVFSKGNFSFQSRSNNADWFFKNRRYLTSH